MALTEATVETKVKPYKSKTILTALLNWAVIKFVPGASQWISENPELYAEILTVVFLVLRHFSSGKIKWKFWQKASLSSPS